MRGGGGGLGDKCISNYSSFTRMLKAKSYLFTLLMDVLTRSRLRLHVICKIAKDIVLIDETRKRVNFGKR